MRIAINGWFQGQLGTGSGQYLEGLRQWFARAGGGHEFVLVEHARRAADGEGDDRGEHSAWHTLPVRTPFDSLDRNLAKLWFEQVSFPLACRRLGAAVGLVPYWGSPLWRPCPMVTTVHDLIPLLLPLYRGGLPQRAYTWLAKRSVGKAKAVLTDSEASKRDIVAHLDIPAERVHAVHLAVGGDVQPVTNPNRLAQVQAQYGLPDEPFLLYLGGFDSRKNVRRMLAGYAQLGARLQGTPSAGDVVPPLVIAGKLPEADTPFAPDPRPIVRRLGIEHLVSFAGWINEADKPALYSLALAALFVSEYEGFGLPVLEAQACGCPVITSER